MADMSWEHADEARAALHAIVSDPEHGVAALSSAQTMSNLLKDLLPDAPREKSMLVAAAEAGMANTLRDHVAQGMDPSTAIRLTASSFSATTPFTPDACTWVAGEVAIALGISEVPPGGGPLGGPLGGAPAGFTPLDQQGMATQMPSGFGGPGQGPPQAPPAQGYPQAPAPGYPQAPPTQGYPQGPGPGYPQAPQPGYPQGPGQGYPQGPQPGYPQGPGQGGGYNPGFGGGQPPQPGPWPGGGTGPGGGRGGPKRGLLIGGGAAVVLILVIVLVISLGKHPPKNPTPTPTASLSTQPSTPSVSPTPVVSGSVESLQTILHPPGEVATGKTCGSGTLANLSAATITDRLFCSTRVTNVVFWAWQFNTAAEYRTGLRKLRGFTGFNASGAGSNCPPPAGDADGATNWHTLSNPKYHSTNGQFFDCYTDHSKTAGDQATYLWTMASQRTVFIAWGGTKSNSFKNLNNWWTKLDYG